MNAVSYWPTHDVWHGYASEIEKLIVANGFQDVCDVGGGANPALTDGFIESRKIRYTLVDISQEELDKAPAAVRKRRQDITKTEELDREAYDLVFTRMLAEHVPSGRVLHSNIFEMLRPGGMAVHFFPTLFAPPFILNKLIPEAISTFVLDAIAPRSKYQHAKFKAYYDWCRGPTKRALERLEHIGYRVIEYRGVYGHHGYYQRLPPVHGAHERLCRMLLKFPIPQITSYAFVVLKKPVQPHV